MPSTPFQASFHFAPAREYLNDVGEEHFKQNHVLEQFQGSREQAPSGTSILPLKEIMELILNFSLASMASFEPDRLTYMVGFIFGA